MSVISETPHVLISPYFLIAAALLLTHSVTAPLMFASVRAVVASKRAVKAHKNSTRDQKEEEDE
jgi:hypothetical protein